VLIVEDDPELRSVTAALLEGEQLAEQALGYAPGG